MITNGEWLFSKPFDEQVAWMNAEHQDGTLDGDTASLNARIAELTAERDELKERADYSSHGWAKANIGWAEANAEAEKWRMKCNEYREKFGKCLDYADAIHALMDEGMA